MASVSVKVLVIVLGLLAVMTSLVTSSTMTNIAIKPKAEECIFVDITEEGTVVEIQFKVTRGGSLDILRCMAPNGNTVLDELVSFNQDRGDEVDAIRAFSAQQKGPYSVCFDNRHSRWTPKRVSFQINLDSATFVPENPNTIAKKSDLNPLEWATTRIRGSLTTVEKELEHYKVREQSHRDIAESTLNRISYLSVFETLVVIILGLSQIYILRNWFNKKAQRMT